MPELTVISAIGPVEFWLLILLSLLLLYFSIRWVYRDAESRGKSGCLVAVMIALISWPASLLLWLVFRPERQLPEVLKPPRR